jgi:hypothetical protein
LSLIVSGAAIISGTLSASRYDGSGAGLFDIPASALKDLQLDRIQSGSGRAIVSPQELNVNVPITAALFIGDGGGLFNIPANALEDLQLDRIRSGSVEAVISPNLGLEVNTSVRIHSGSLTVSGSVFVSGGNIVAQSGSTFVGDGSGLSNINIANLSFETFLLKSGSFTASISPDKGFVTNASASIWGSLYVGNDITGSNQIYAPIVSGGLRGTYAYEGNGPTASIDYDILRFDPNRGHYIPQPETSLTETVSFNNVSSLTIVHNLGIRYPMVQVYATGSEDQILPGTIKSIDDDTIQIVFSGLTSGHAVIGSGGSLIQGSIQGDRVIGTVLSSSYAVRAGVAESIIGFNSASLAALGDLENFVRNSQTSSMAVFSAVSSSFALTASYALNAGDGGGTDLFVYYTSSLVKSQTAKINFTGSGVSVTTSGSDGVLVTILGGGGAGGCTGDLLSSQTSSMLVGTASLAFTAS